MPGFTAKHWRYLLLAIVVVDVLVVAGLGYVFSAANLLAQTQTAAGLPTPTATITPTPWAGPGPRPTATPTLPPTPTATVILGPSGFPVGFTPTPFPTREPVTLKLPQLFLPGKNRVDVPVINQIHYPEPFFPAGTNNACGPVSLYAAIQGLGVNVDYSRLRNIAVNNGFNAEGTSTWGLINTAVTLNSELGNPLKIEYGNRYNSRELLKQLRGGGVVLVLVRVRRDYNGWRVTGDPNSSIGHFLLVERMSFKGNKVTLAGSTLGMDQVSALEFVRSWRRDPNLTIGDSWSNYLDNEPANNWAIILKRS